MLLTVNTGSSSLRLAAFVSETRNDPAETLRVFLKDHGIEEAADVAGDIGVEMVRRAGEVHVNAA